MPWEEMSKVWSPGPPQSVKGDVTKPTYWPSPPPRSPSNISNFRLQTSWFQLQTLCPKMSKVSWHCPAASSSRISTWYHLNAVGYVWICYFRCKECYSSWTFIHWLIQQSTHGFTPSLGMGMWSSTRENLQLDSFSTIGERKKSYHPLCFKMCSPLNLDSSGCTASMW